jgi:hypothetical protein
VKPPPLFDSTHFPATLGLVGVTSPHVSGTLYIFMSCMT